MSFLEMTWIFEGNEEGLSNKSRKIVKTSTPRAKSQLLH